MRRWQNEIILIDQIILRKLTKDTVISSSLDRERKATHGVGIKQNKNVTLSQCFALAPKKRLEWNHLTNQLCTQQMKRVLFNLFVIFLKKIGLCQCSDINMLMLCGFYCDTIGVMSETIRFPFHLQGFCDCNQILWHLNGSWMCCRVDVSLSHLDTLVHCCCVGHSDIVSFYHHFNTLEE